MGPWLPRPIILLSVHQSLLHVTPSVCDTLDKVHAHGAALAVNASSNRSEVRRVTYPRVIPPCASQAFTKRGEEGTEGGAGHIPSAHGPSSSTQRLQPQVM